MGQIDVGWGILDSADFGMVEGFGLAGRGTVEADTADVFVVVIGIWECVGGSGDWVADGTGDLCFPWERWFLVLLFPSDAVLLVHLETLEVAHLKKS